MVLFSLRICSYLRYFDSFLTIASQLETEALSPRGGKFMDEKLSIWRYCEVIIIYINTYLQETFERSLHAKLDCVASL